MKITNKHGLPEPFVKAVTFDSYQRVGDISVTELVQPPQKLELTRQHDHEIEEDASDRMWMLDGSAMHVVLERVGVDNALQEERLTVDVEGWTVSGKPDLYEADGTLWDYKKTSVWSFMLGEKADWEAQLNLYALLLHEHGFSVTRLMILAALRDWNKAQRGQNGYPEAGGLAKEVRLWPVLSQRVYLEERVRLHQLARNDQHWDHCTPEERWARPDNWAVIKGSGNAKGVFGDGTKRGGGEEEAYAFADEKGGDVEFRPGKSVRCEDYCGAAPWCGQWKELQHA